MTNWDNNIYYIGCNYWASHAGIRMWQNWNAEEVTKDLDLMVEYGMNLLRVFPVWSDFQPLTQVYGWSGTPRDFMQNDCPLQNNEALDKIMLERFAFLCKEAEKRKLNLLVSLVTGWMSGRLFVPTALERRSLLTDAVALQWQTRYVRGFVREMRNEKAIIAWDLGNECNCLGQVKNSAEAWNWINTITSAIRLEDSSRPVISGMHGLTTNKFALWNLQDQGELLDMVTTHPYTLFTACCNNDEVNNFHSEQHASAESLLYSGISGKACLVEEAGILGPLVASQDADAANMRVVLYSCLVNGMTGYLRWCAFDQEHLDYPPYEHLAMERELGLFKADRTPKKAAKVMKEFSEFLCKYNGKLPPRKIDAVCIVSEREDAWLEAYGAFLLSRKANFDIVFAGAEHDLPEANRYILPVIGNEPITRSRYLKLLEKVEKGADLLITMSGESILNPFEEVTGVRLDSRYKQGGSSQANLRGQQVLCPYNVRSMITALQAEVIFQDDSGNPLMTCALYGKGRVFFINAGIEKLEAEATKDILDNPLYLFYKEFAERSGIKRIVETDCPLIGITEHQTENDNLMALLINYTPTKITANIRFDGKLISLEGGVIENGKLIIAPNQATVMIID